jgi:sulfite dehydrogenase (quinone) subunit SoeC
MIGKFNVEQSSQGEWAWLLALYLFLGSLGGCLFLLVRIFSLPPAFAVVSIGLVLLGAVTIMFKLGSPQRAWRAISRPATSWISRGALCVACFFMFGCLSIAPSIAALSWLPWNDGTTLGSALGWVAALFALLTAIYPGFVVSNFRAIPFWNTPLVPLLFFTYAALAAAGVVLLGASSAPGNFAQVALLAEVLIVVNAALSAVHLLVMSRVGGSASESVRRLNRVPLGTLFWIGVVLVGWIVPLATLMWMESATMLAGACIQIGAILFRYCVLKAGVYYVPAALTPAKMDFSTLTRTSADFAREYAGMTANRATGRR